jgi:glycosyltransferase involved in cell wall biosynthesis
MSPPAPPRRRILLASRGCYLDDSSGAAVAFRAMLQAMARCGFAVEALTGAVRESADTSSGPDVLLAERGFAFDTGGGAAWAADPRGLRVAVPLHYRLTVQDVPVTLHRTVSARPYEPHGADIEEFLHLLEAAMTRFQPDVLVSFGDDHLSRQVRSRARTRKVPVVFVLHNLTFSDLAPFTAVDAVIVPSRFAAAHHRRALGLDCTRLPSLIDLDRVRTSIREPRYLTFINPAYEKGVYVFARIADELGRRRPDIPILVVESRGSERTLVDCGLDLRLHGNVNLMGQTSDPRQFWAVTRLCLLPSLRWDNQPLVAIEAMINGIPVIGSDRGGIPECLGRAGIVLPLPERLAPSTRELPTADEVGPWIEAIIRLWDGADWYAEHSRRALAEARRWDPDRLEPLYVRFFNEIRPAADPAIEVARLRSSRSHTPLGSGGESAEAVREVRPSIEAGIRVIRRRWPGIINDCDDDPVFVLAAGWRSGSTMLQRMIMRSCFLWGEPFGHATLIDLLADPIRCFTERWPESHHFHFGEDTDTLSKSFIANLYPPISDLLRAHQSYFSRLFAEPARRNGAIRWGLKEVRLDCDHAFYLRWLFPRARFLFLIRNPYDAWRSYAARAALGWKWYLRWPTDPVTVTRFAAHWRRLVTSFIENHHRVDGLIVRYEALARGEYPEAEEYLGFPLAAGAGRMNPSDGGPAPPGELAAADRIVLENELGSLASSMGYEVRA